MEQKNATVVVPVGLSAGTLALPTAGTTAISTAGTTAATWPRHAVRKRTVVAACAAVAVAIASFQFVWWVPSDDSRASKYFVLIGLLFVFVAAYGIALRIRRPRGTDGVRLVSGSVGVLTIEARRLQFPLLMAVVVIFGAITITAGIDWFTSMSGGLRIAGCVVLFGFALWCAGYPIAALRRKLGSVELEFTSSTIRFKAMSYEVDMPWDAVAGVVVLIAGGPRIVVLCDDPQRMRAQYRTKLWLFDSMPRTQSIVIDPFQFDCAPAILLNLFAYYARHPEARGEFVTTKAMDRVHSWAHQL